LSASIELDHLKRNPVAAPNEVPISQIAQQLCLRVWSPAIKSVPSLFEFFVTIDQARARVSFVAFS
jgi:hypothetical protein